MHFIPYAKIYMFFLNELEAIPGFHLLFLLDFFVVIIIMVSRLATTKLIQILSKSQRLNEKKQ